MTLLPKMGFLGPKGTFSEKALKTYLTHTGLQVEASAFVVITAALSEGYEFLVLPWENSTEGSIVEALDFLIGTPHFTIIGEVILPIEQVLLAKAGTSVTDITDILSHPQPLAQCHDYLQAHFSQISCHKVSSTAYAAQCVSKGDHRVLAAIGNEELAEIYQLDILARHIQDSEHNSTRFVVVQKGNVLPPATGHDKTTLVFSTQKDRPGSLVEVLSEFSLRGINMTSIISRPAKKKLGDYLFLIECKGHQNDASFTEALAEIKTKTSFLKILGSYPEWRPNS